MARPAAAAGSSSPSDFIEKHGRATPGKIRAAIREHEEALNNAVAAAQGSLLSVWGRQDAHKAAKAALRRFKALKAAVCCPSRRLRSRAPRSLETVIAFRAVDGLRPNAT